MHAMRRPVAAKGVKQHRASAHQTGVREQVSLSLQPTPPTWHSRSGLRSGRGGLALVEGVHARATPGFLGDVRVVDARRDLCLG